MTTNFIYFLSGKSYLADNVTLGLGEAVEEMIVISKGDYVAYLIEIEVGVDRVGAKGKPSLS